jgi:dTDP-glucose 4,6-dehydratase
MANVLISGGAGFLGSHLSDLLLAEGHRVTVVDNFVTGRPENVAHLASDSNFELIEHDVSTPLSYSGDVDYLMHMASPASPPDFTRIPFETMKAGSYATHELLELARQKGARFFLASTSEAYGDPPPEEHPQREEYHGNVSTTGKRSVYDEAKRYAEAATMAYQRHYNLETRIVRIFNTYGTRMRPDDGRVVTNFMTQALRNEPITLHGDGSQTRSFCYVEDLVNGIYRLLLSDEPMPTNIGNPGEFTVRQLAERVVALTESKSEITCIEQPFTDDPKQRRPDISKAKRVLEWEPKIPLDEGLTRMIPYMREQLGL